MPQYNAIYWQTYWYHRFNGIGPIAANRMAEAAEEKEKAPKEQGPKCDRSQETQS
jgi:hypothetical protein